MTPAEALAAGCSIFPTGPNKRPIIASWKPFQDRRPTDAEISAWSRRNPATWALVTGALSGRITLDFDGEPGRKTLERLGVKPHRQTPSGGFHADFKHPGWYVRTLNAKTKRELGERWPGLDIRADGGYVVFTGRTDRGEYRWLRDPEPYELDILPAGLREFLGLLKPPAAGAPEQRTNGKHHAMPANGRVDSERLIRAALDRIASGGRNNAGFWLATQLRDNGYTQVEAESAMQNYCGRVPATNAKGDREAYTSAEVRATVEQVYGRPARQPWEHSSSSGAPLSNLESHHAAQEWTQQAPGGDWRKELIQAKNGATVAVLANAVTAFRKAPEWDGVLAFNEFSLGVVMRKPTPFGGQAGAAWTDHEDRLAADWLQHHGVLVGVEVAGQAVQAAARDRSFHPVRDYLTGLRWDGTKRLEGWLNLYLGVDSTDYSIAVGDRYLRSAVARIMEPGCQADCCLILEGAQGIKKSTALRILGQPWFTDEIADLGSKDAALQTRGIWLIEIAELDGMTRAEVGKIKAFMSRAVDRFRPPYGRHLLESPRQCVFAGSVNHGAYLRDETGGRRFWPVSCSSRILVDELTRDRDQLWAEAFASYRAGKPWWLETQALSGLAEDEQAQRYEESAWDSLILNWAAERLAMGSSSISVAECLDLCIGKRTGEWTRVDEMRVGRCLSASKWERYRDRKNGMQWRYRPRVPTSSGNMPQGGNTASD